MPWISILACCLASRKILSLSLCKSFSKSYLSLLLGGGGRGGTLWALSTKKNGVRLFLPKVAVSQCSINSTGFFPSSFSGMPTMCALLRCSLFSMFSALATLSDTLGDVIWTSWIRGGKSSSIKLTLPSKVAAFSLIFCMSCLMGSIPSFILLTSTESSVRGDPQVWTEVRISCKVGSLFSVS